MKRSYPKYTEIDILFVIENRSTMSVAEIAKLLGKSYESVRHLIAKLRSEKKICRAKDTLQYINLNIYRYDNYVNGLVEPPEALAYQMGSTINYRGEDHMVISDLGMRIEIVTNYKHGKNEVITIDKSELSQLINITA